MRKIIIIPALTAIMMVLPLSCSKFESAENTASGRMVNISVHAEKCISEEDGALSKVGYSISDNKFSFEEGDMMQILIGKYTSESVTSQTSVRIPMDTGNPGYFSGSFLLEDGYALSDIRGAVLVRNATPSGNYTLGSYNSNPVVKFKMTQNQVQSANGEFSDNTGRFVFYAQIPQDKLITDDESDTLRIDKLTFKLRSGLWEYHIYGAGRQGENIQSISVSTAGSSVASKYIMTCTHNISVSSGSHQSVGGTYAYTSMVSLSTPCAVPAASADAVVLYHTLYATSNTVKELGSVIVTTDKAVYKRDFGGALAPSVSLGQICPIFIDISEGGNFVRLSNTYEISTDGGSSWSEWNGDLPAGSNYTSLAVKSGTPLTSSALSSIVTWINNQASPVALDLSGIDYESVTFPQVFGNSTAASACVKLSAIKFPSNVTGMATNAFRNCTALASVDFSNITSISGAGTDCHTFRGCTALTTVSLPKLQTMGRYTFYQCSNLTTITFGPDVTSFGGRSMESCPKLADVYVYATTPPSQNGNTYFLTNSGTSAPHKIIHVPAGCVDTYENYSCTFSSKTLTPWKYSTTGYTLTEIE